MYIGRYRARITVDTRNLKQSGVTALVHHFSLPYPCRKEHLPGLGCSMVIDVPLDKCRIGSCLLPPIGVGNATGTGASAARLFAQKGYKVALISRGPESLNKLAEELSQHGGHMEFGSLFWRPPTKNSITSLDINIGAAFAFSREVITEFLKLRFEGPGEGGQGGARKRGTLLFTGTAASIRGNVTSSAFAAGKRGLRALSQSLAKEFGKKNIHVRL
ncbi:hypothetical protein F5141DRAFT_1060397 [Pisolithus sp. B1]|nr:hypothetical protein F5141DRAFT_1060397 [Pisolithus sp. B1]